LQGGLLPVLVEFLRSGLIVDHDAVDVVSVRPALDVGLFERMDDPDLIVLDQRLVLCRKGRRGGECQRESAGAVEVYVSHELYSIGKNAKKTGRWSDARSSTTRRSEVRRVSEPE